MNRTINRQSVQVLHRQIHTVIIRMGVRKMVKPVQHHLSSHTANLLKVLLNDPVRCYTARSRLEQYNLHKLVLNTF